ncbi:hypothetical protein [Ciceribacter selenitireducens]|uniref:Uncharacterized protein n=1 Tax=Ciceribacter selenitireducens ATCC BAA-1503 TaxID=1336235 RepID=A0A376AEK4_9HYPH|nr:hypothetical protein [Ciceribacter selenitireducens]SSC66252.1 unnamed protein product [Ciceribacter selenitireducens ATCC BAA-1503]
MAQMPAVLDERGDRRASVALMPDEGGFDGVDGDGFKWSVVSGQRSAFMV